LPDLITIKIDKMTKDEIIEAFENLRYFESTDEIEWGRVLAEADRAIKALKQGQ